MIKYEFKKGNSTQFFIRRTTYKLQVILRTKKAVHYFERLCIISMQSFYFRFAWAAATRAIGTRYGEQLT